MSPFISTISLECLSVMANTINTHDGLMKSVFEADRCILLLIDVSLMIIVKICISIDLYVDISMQPCHPPSQKPMGTATHIRSQIGREESDKKTFSWAKSLGIFFERVVQVQCGLMWPSCPQKHANMGVEYCDSMCAYRSPILVTILYKPHRSLPPTSTTFHLPSRHPSWQIHPSISWCGFMG